jgi:quinol monooxygenase YgiN
VNTATSTGAVALYAEFAAAPGRGKEVEKLIADFAEQVRAEPGNLVFDVYCRADEPERFFVYEIYRDQAAFDTHIAAERGATFNSALKELTVGDGSTLTFLRSVTALP